MGISVRLVWFFAVIFEGGRLGTKNGKVYDGLCFISISVSDRNSTLTDIYTYIYVCGNTPSTLYNNSLGGGGEW